MSVSIDDEIKVRLGSDVSDGIDTVSSNSPSRAPAATLENSTTTADPPNAPYSTFSTAEKRAIVFLVALAGFFSPFSAFIYFPALQDIANALSVSLEVMNLTVTLYAVVQGIVPSLFGDMAETLGRRPACLLIFSIYVLASVGLALQDSYPALILLRMVQSAGSSGTIVLAYGVIGDIAAPYERAGYVGAAHVGLAATGINRTLISVVQNRRQGDEPVLTRPTFRFPNPIRSLRLVFHKTTSLVLFSNAIFYMKYSCVQASLSPLLIKVYGLNELQVGLAYLAFGIACAAASYTVGKFKSPSRRTIY
ncbi:hypothetical protein MMC26_004948 [Xylographa opegraphella]|nr:hypothetical protein [Xylographa opegraphella]